MLLPSAPNVVRASGSVLFELTGVMWTGLSLGSDGAAAVQLGPILEVGEGFVKAGVQILSSIGGIRVAQGYSYDFVLGYSQPL
ncbi:hypothetical protein FUA23_11395 [Neolewinella aurantiaca]|uniref:Uncharacterized protein n=1 Tax=Neolewinella aurantiaca TaxID=2602767 RepID=A0A5C7FSV5_9BACT|nr:hypothetical protein FUA23_11395 [Neolewinella aurantiaca]